MRKTRSDSRMAALPETTRDELLAMDERREPLRVMRAWLHEQGHRFAASTISDWLAQERTARFAARLKSAAAVADEVAKEAAAASGDDVDNAIIAGVKELTLDLISRQGTDPKDLRGLLGLVLQSRKQDLEARRVAVLERKAEQADKARAITTDEKLSPAEKEARYRAVFGIA